MKRYKKQWLRHARILFAVLILLMVAGSIWDLPISRALYPGHESSIGQFFAAFGGQPAFLAISAAGALLLLVQTVAALFGFTLDLGEIGDKLLAVVNAVFALLVILGVVNDPTTAGIADSKQARTYISPKED